VLFFHVRLDTNYDFVHGWRVDESCGACLDGGGSGKKKLQGIAGASYAAYAIMGTLTASYSSQTIRMAIGRMQGP